MTATGLPCGPNWPSAWASAPLWSLFERVKDVGHPNEDLLSVYRGYGVVLREGRHDNHNVAAENRNIYQLVDKDWLVVNRMKAWQGSVGISPRRGIVSGHYLCYRPRHNHSSPYLNWLLRSDVYKAEFARMSRGVRPGQIEIDNDELRALRIALPDHSEQGRISQFLDIEVGRIDRLRDTMLEFRALLQERRESAVYDLVLGADRDREERVDLAWARYARGDWPSVKLSYVARMGSGHTPSRSRPEWWVDCTVPWITTGEVHQIRDDRSEQIDDTREKISLAGIENSSAEIHPRGTVVLCRTASAGYSAVMSSDMATSQDFVTWTCGKELDPIYLLWSLRAMRRDLLGRLATGSTHKTIYVPDLQGLRVLLPTMSEQRAVVNEIRRSNSEIDRILDSVDAQLVLMSERRTALIAQAVTGNIDVATARGSEV